MAHKTESYTEINERHSSRGNERKSQSNGRVGRLDFSLPFNEEEVLYWRLPRGEVKVSQMLSQVSDGLVLRKQSRCAHVCLTIRSCVVQKKQTNLWDALFALLVFSRSGPASGSVLVEWNLWRWRGGVFSVAGSQFAERDGILLLVGWSVCQCVSSSSFVVDVTWFDLLECVVFAVLRCIWFSLSTGEAVCIFCLLLCSWSVIWTSKDRAVRHPLHE